MYIFDLNRCTESAGSKGDRSADSQQNMYMPVSHTNRGSIQNMMGMVMNYSFTCIESIGL